MSDLADLRADVVALVAEFGRDVVLRRAGAADATAGKPWRGPDAGGDADTTVRAVLYDSKYFRGPGGAAIRADQVALIAADDLAQSPPAVKDMVLDGGRTYVVADGVEVVRPGSAGVVYIVPLEG